MQTRSSGSNRVSFQDGGDTDLKVISTEDKEDDIRKVTTESSSFPSDRKSKKQSMLPDKLRAKDSAAAEPSNGSTSGEEGQSAHHSSQEVVAVNHQSGDESVANQEPAEGKQKRRSGLSHRSSKSEDRRQSGTTKSGSRMGEQGGDSQNSNIESLEGMQMSAKGDAAGKSPEVYKETLSGKEAPYTFNSWKEVWPLVNPESPSFISLPGSDGPEPFLVLSVEVSNHVLLLLSFCLLKCSHMSAALLRFHVP
ncbi:hypothetical protein CBR_g45918 [Chara braunii]|uniref:Uncharacterized protein n=1 Tax=Chara braunii TaxID=69332 RepID=A0A388LZT7_CHABU|nr:hypothetical protein CBR_g45918 [Chara braunii]|eukprot:GBG87763.1 hypothetical protein CBR_g45918 [Chara braunii]